MLVYENNNYIVDTGDNDDSIYRVINKMSGVVEVEEAMLPKCIDYAQQLDIGVAEVMEQFELYPEDRSRH